MRRSMIAVLGAAAVLLAASAPSDARPRFGPGAILRALPGPFGAIFGGVRRGSGPRHVRRSKVERAAPPRAADTARLEQPAPVGAHAAWIGPVFWPHASDDLLEYAALVNDSGARFWTYGYGDILDGMFFASEARHADTRQADAGHLDAGAPVDSCGAAAASAGADAWIERIAQALAPTSEQRELLERLRTALARASDTIRAACRTVMPATPLERLTAMQDRLWAMRDGALTIRGPLEDLYDRLTDAQKARLGGSDPNRRGKPGATGAPAGTPTQLCNAQGRAIAEWPTKAIEHALRPSEHQRASLEGLRMSSAGMAHLLMTACPTEAHDDPLRRLAIATERVTVMLFAVKTTSASFYMFYESLTEDQKSGLGKLTRPPRRAGRVAGGP